MNGSFKARWSAKERMIVAIALFSLIAWHMPASAAHAQTPDLQNSLTFEIKSQNQKTLSLVDQPQLVAKIDMEVALVKSYLQSKNSPFANYTEILLAQDDWKVILAVSNSESTLGQHCYVNNCSGIFGNKGLRTYSSIPDWIVDMQNLINKRYKGWTLDKMDGIYVQPRSSNWIEASSQVYKDLSKIEDQVNNSQT